MNQIYFIANQNNTIPRQIIMYHMTLNNKNIKIIYITGFGLGTNLLKCAEGLEGAPKF